MTLLDYGKQYKEILKVNVVYLIKLVILHLKKIWFKIRFFLNELLYNSSACMFHRLNTNKRLIRIDYNHD